MNKPNVSTLKKYLAAMSKIKAKYITSERLSRVIGIYPEIINENLAYFDPMIKMDSSANLLELVPDIKKYIEEEESKKAPAVHIAPVYKKEVEEYKDVNDFVYRKYAVGGMINKSAELSEKDLRILKKLVSEELAKRKKK